MQSISLAEARQNLDHCVKRAIAGEEIAIEVDGKLVALNPVFVSTPESRAQALTALDQLQSISKVTKAAADEYCAQLRRDRNTYRDE